VDERGIAGQGLTGCRPARQGHGGASANRKAAHDQYSEHKL